MKRDLTSIEQLSDAGLRRLMGHADQIRRDLRGHAEQLPGFLLGSLFLEPSTRTRLSFEAAMARLGGQVITSDDPAMSSASKGESLADTVRIVGSYVDLLVLRHPKAGAARWAAQHASGPVINAGDGSHEHPTQTLCDLYALHSERGRIDELTVVLYGDLRYGRTTHSLARALVRFGARIIAIPEAGLELPEYVLEDLATTPGYRVHPVVVDDLPGIFGRSARSATLIAPQGLWSEVEPGHSVRLRERSVDAIYVTRLQRERLRADQEGATALPILDHRFLASEPFRNTVVLHPLPRVQEIAPEVDRDPRAAYFRQAAHGVPVRMALLLWCAERIDLPAAIVPSEFVPEAAPLGWRCTNEGCIASDPVEGVPAEVGRGRDGRLACAWCEEAQAADGGGA